LGPEQFTILWAGAIAEAPTTMRCAEKKCNEKITELKSLRTSYVDINDSPTCHVCFMMFRISARFRGCSCNGKDGYYENPEFINCVVHNPEIWEEDEEKDEKGKTK